MSKASSKPAANAAGFRDRIVGFRRIPAAQLVVDKLNPIRHGKKQRNALLAGLKTLGIVDALLVRERDDGKFALIDGALRKSALRGQSVPCLILDLSEEESLIALASMRAIGDLADYEPETLAALLTELQAAPAWANVERELADMLAELAEAQGVDGLGLDDDAADAEPAADKKPKGGRRSVSLNYDPAEIKAFAKYEKELRRLYETQTEAATVLETMRVAYAVAAHERTKRGKAK